MRDGLVQTKNSVHSNSLRDRLTLLAISPLPFLPQSASITPPSGFPPAHTQNTLSANHHAQPADNKREPRTDFGLWRLAPGAARAIQHLRHLVPEGPRPAARDDHRLGPCNMPQPSSAVRQKRQCKIQYFLSCIETQRERKRASRPMHCAETPKQPIQNPTEPQEYPLLLFCVPGASPCPSTAARHDALGSCSSAGMVLQLSLAWSYTSVVEWKRKESGLRPCL